MSITCCSHWRRELLNQGRKGSLHNMGDFSTPKITCTLEKLVLSMIVER
jgi:hypothetical protein